MRLIVNNKKSLLMLSVCALIAAGCGNETKDPDSLPPDSDTVKTNILNVNGEIFSIPSPIQTAFLIKKSGATYDKGVLNPANKSAQYSTNFSKALNLGIYGADLAYVTMYDKTQDAIGYMNSAKRLADDLGVSGAFETSIMERFQKNLGNQDSMLVLTGIAYRSSDSYLKSNDRSDVSGLVLAGGWLESLYFATKLYNNKQNEDIKRRISEQKSSLNSLIKLLNQFYSQPEYAEFVDALRDLEAIYTDVTSTYTFVQPTTDVENKVTTINSKTDIKITAAHIDAITKKVAEIRNLVVGN